MALIKGKQLADSTIASAKIANDAIVEDKIATGAVSETKIAANAVVSAKIAANAIDNTKIATNAVRQAHIQDGEVIEAKLAANSVTSAKINAGAVTAAKLGAGAVETAKIADDAITLAKIDDSIIISEAEGIALNDTDTTIPTSAAVKDYVDQNSASGAVTSVSGTANQITVTGTATPVISLPADLQLPAATTAGTTPTATDHVATKGYVDSVAQGLVIKDPVDYMFISRSNAFNAKEATGRLENTFTYDATAQKWTQNTASALSQSGPITYISSGTTYIVYQQTTPSITSLASFYSSGSSSVGGTFTATSSGSLPSGVSVVEAGGVWGLKTNPDIYGTDNVSGDLSALRILVAPLGTNNLTVGNGIFKFTAGQGDVTIDIHAASALVNGRKYTISTAGSSVNWTSIGASDGNVGTSFTYNGTAVSGSAGEVKENYVLERTDDLPADSGASGSSIVVDKGFYADKNFVITADKYQTAWAQTSGSLNTSNFYEIASLGNTNWNSLFGVTNPAVGSVFKPASNASLSGTGTYRQRNDIVGTSLLNITQFSTPTGAESNSGIALSSSNKYQLDIANLSDVANISSSGDDLLLIRPGGASATEQKVRVDTFFEGLLSSLLQNIEEVITIGKPTSGSSEQIVKTSADLNLSNTSDYNSLNNGTFVVVDSNYGSVTRAEIAAKGFVGVNIDLTTSTTNAVPAGTILKKETYSSGAMASSKYLVVNKVFTVRQDTGGATNLRLNSLQQNFGGAFLFKSHYTNGSSSAITQNNKLTSGRDFLHFNPTTATFQLETSDDLRIVYLAVE